LDLKQLRTLLAIAETGSMTSAAEMLHIVQPAVSRQLRLLEEELGSTLFERGRRGMQLTVSGEILADRARRALRELDQARAEIVPTPGEISGTAAIGLLPSTSELLAGPLVSAMRKKHPRLSLRVIVGFTGHLQQWLEEGDIDIALLYGPKPSSLLEIHSLLDESLYLVSSPATDVHHGAASVSLRELAGCPLILPNQPHGIRTLLDRACAAEGLQLDIVTETNAMSVQKELVIRGLGSTVLPKVAVFDDVARGTLVAYPITDPELHRHLVLALPMTRRSSSAVRYVMAEMRALIEAMVHSNQWPGAKLVAQPGLTG